MHTDIDDVSTQMSLPLTMRNQDFFVLRFSNKTLLLDHLTQSLCDQLSNACNEPQAIMLSGGRTPFPAYNQIAQNPPSSSGIVHLFFSDERYVPLDSDKSNYNETRPLIHSLNLTTETVHAIDPSLPLQASAANYHHQIQTLIDENVRFPFGILGMGTDGHTAGLFSQQDLKRDIDKWATWVRRPDGLDGITVTPKLLRQIEKLVFIILGSAKRDTLSRLLKHNTTAGQSVIGHPGVEIWCDEEAWPGSSKT